MRIALLATALAALPLATLGALHMVHASHPAPIPARARAADPPVRPTRLIAPHGKVRSFVILFSDDDGWDETESAVARNLATRGIAVAGVDTRAFLHQLDAGAGACVHPVQPLMRLAQEAEHRLGWSNYLRPALAGRGLGGTFVYATLAQAVPGVFVGGISVDYAGFLPGGKPWCRLNGYTATRVQSPAAGWRPGPAAQLPTPWRDVQLDPAGDQSARILAGTPLARRIMADDEASGIATALSPLLPHSGQGPLADLPLTETSTPGAPATQYFAIVYSGDGGWAGLDRKMAAEFARRGVPVVGLDSLAYFWRSRPPASAAVDLGRIIQRYGTRWNRPRALLVGYSFGADVLPFITADLPPASRSHVARLSLIGLSPKADFQFHFASWLNVSSSAALPTVPRIDTLRGLPLQCIRGIAESASACPAIAPGRAQQIAIPGNHYFNGNAALLVDAMTGGLAA